MNEEEKEEIINMCNDIYEGEDWQPMINYIEKLKKELEYEKELRIRYERRYDLCKESKDKLQKENEQLKEENFDQVYMKAIADYKEKIRKIKKRLENGDTRCYPGADGTEFAIRIIDELLEEEND